MRYTPIKFIIGVGVLTALWWCVWEVPALCLVRITDYITGASREFRSSWGQWRILRDDRCFLPTSHLTVPDLCSRLSVVIQREIKTVRLIATLFLKMTVVWDVAPYILEDIGRRFRGAYCLHHQGTSETSVSIYETTRRNIPEDSDLHTRCCENLKSHFEFSFNVTYIYSIFMKIVNILSRS
jgi:hypothetical protein